VSPLRGLVDDWHVLGAAVERRLLGRDARLVADLVDEDAHERAGARVARLAEEWLRGVVEGIPPGLLEPVEVDTADLRPDVTDRRRVGVDVRIAVNGEVVGDRPGAPARAVRVTDLLQETDRRVGDVARRLEVVVAARGEAERDHVDARVDGLESVVARG